MPFDSQNIVSQTPPGEAAASVSVSGAFAHVAPTFLFRWLLLRFWERFGAIFCVLWEKFRNPCKLQLNGNDDCLVRFNVGEKHLHSASRCSVTARFFLLYHHSSPLSAHSLFVVVSLFCMNVSAPKEMIRCSSEEALASTA